jgi:hypothetical protein
MNMWNGVTRWEGVAPLSDRNVEALFGLLQIMEELWSPLEMKPGEPNGSSTE